MEIKRVLIANRGEIAIRIARTCKKMGIEAVTVFTKHDEGALHCVLSSASYCISSYSDPNEYIRIAKLTDSQAVHPGYGFLAENVEFADICASQGIKFIGPSSTSLQLFGCKRSTKELAISANVPTLPGSGILKNTDEALQAAKKIGYPVLVKPVFGGGGIGIQECHNDNDVICRIEGLRTLTAKHFGNGDMMMEKYLPRCRHIEVQVFGDGKGNIAIFGDRECSTQRRFQKVIEEAPAKKISDEARKRMFEAARRLCSMANYEFVGTVEFLVNADDTNQFYITEVNPRIQVEHQVTELTHGGIDFVELMIQQCTVNKPNIEDLEKTYKCKGHAIQVRLYAEDPDNDFRPCSGVIQEFEFPVRNEGFQLETAVCRGSKVTPFYDPMIAKVLQWGHTRDQTIQMLLDSLSNAQVYGPPNNLDYITSFIKTDAFMKCEVTTKTLGRFQFVPNQIKVINPGLLTTVQCYPGREAKGLWRVGVPPSAAMDPLSCSLANRLVGNKPEEAVLECTMKGPTIVMNKEASIALTGAQAVFQVDGKPMPMWKGIKVPSGSTVSIGRISGDRGVRVYLAVKGGIDVPPYLGSKSTFINGAYGGHQGRKLESGDVLKIGDYQSAEEISLNSLQTLPEFTNSWQIKVLPGPYANPDYFTDEDINMLYSTPWKVHHDSNRLGIRLQGPAPSWARSDGGEGGSHPSNVHDYVYAVGTVNFTGDMPIIIGSDGPSLGGFVCPCTIIEAELWKIGQLRAGDSVLFVPTTIEEALKARKEQEENIKTLFNDSQPLVTPHFSTSLKTQAVLLDVPANTTHPGMQVRLCGDRYILVEYGPMVLDLNLRCRIHFLEKHLLEECLDGLEETAPGVRTLLIRYNGMILPIGELVNHVSKIDKTIPDISQLVIPTRVLHLPMCFNYSGVNNAIQRYMKLVRHEAPYLPSNIDFIRKNNGLATQEDVKSMVFSASYMCLGLGDVYLGAPCAVPLNPLHRVVVPKYNPARTFTQEGTVGLGGSYMCIYPMNSPGGYQLVGRTLAIWNTYANGSPLFRKTKPWLLEMFDQVRFYEVSEIQLDEMRHKFAVGKLDIKVEKEDFKIADYNKLLEDIADDIAKYKTQQKAASLTMNNQERESLSRIMDSNDSLAKDCYSIDESLSGDEEGIYADITGVVGEISVQQGDTVKVEQGVVVLEAMKMQEVVQSPVAGVVTKVLVNVHDMVRTGSLLMAIKKTNQ